GHRSRAAAVDHRRHHAHWRCRHANARACRADDRVHADLPGPRSSRRDLDRIARAGDDVIGLPEIIAGVIAVALNAYVLTGGADFGGGAWALLTTRHNRRSAT